VVHQYDAAHAILINRIFILYHNFNIFQGQDIESYQEENIQILGEHLLIAGIRRDQSGSYYCSAASELKTGVSTPLAVVVRCKSPPPTLLKIRVLKIQEYIQEGANIQSIFLNFSILSF
jgi:hypothetical protein